MSRSRTNLLNINLKCDSYGGNIAICVVFPRICSGLGDSNLRSCLIRLVYTKEKCWLRLLLVLVLLQSGELPMITSIFYRGPRWKVVLEGSPNLISSIPCQRPLDTYGIPLFKTQISLRALLFVVIGICILLILHIL